MSCRKAITKEIQSQIINLVKSGEYRRPEIAKMFDIHNDTVTRILIRNGVRLGKGSEYLFKEIKSIFEQKGYTLLSTSFKKISDRLDFICDKGHKTKISALSLNNGNGCQKCASEKNKIPKEQVIEFIESKGYKVISEYVNVRTKVKVICPKGHETETTFDSFKHGHGCKFCRNINNRGENNWKWNPNRTYEKRRKERKLHENTEWRKNVFVRDDYTCQKCNCRGGKLVAHHLNGYHWDIENRLNINNGITLCEKCHDEFHKIYKTNHNTIEQYNEWANTNLKII